MLDPLSLLALATSSLMLGSAVAMHKHNRRHHAWLQEKYPQATLASMEMSQITQERKILRSRKKESSRPTPRTDSRLGELSHEVQELSRTLGGWQGMRKARKEQDIPIREQLQRAFRARQEAKKEEFQIVRQAHATGWIEQDRDDISTLHTRMQALDNIVSTLSHTPEGALQVRTATLQEYRDQLREGFAFTPSRTQLSDHIQDVLQNTNAILLTGPTGTGKTELAVHMTRMLYGEDPEIIRGNPNVQESTIVGQTGLKGTEKGSTETTFEAGPLVRAMERGVPLIVDEYNLIDPMVRFLFKEIYNRKPGDSVSVPHNGTHTIKEGFCIIATSNLKDDKHQTRFDLDPAEERVFTALEVPYLPKEEFFDLALSSLIPASGQVPLSAQEVSLLKDFSQAVSSIQDTFTNGSSALFLKEGAGTTGKKASLKTTVLDSGRALKMVRGYAISSAKGTSLREHLSSELKLWLTSPTISDNDRNLIAKELSQYNLLNLTLTDLQTEKNTTSVLRAEKSTPSTKGSLSLADAALLDPFGLRTRTLHDDLAQEGKEEDEPPTPESKASMRRAFFESLFTSWSYTQEQQDAFFAHQHPQIKLPSTLDYDSLSSDTDPAKFGEYTLNPDTLPLDYDSIPPEKFEVIDMDQFVGKPRHEVFAHIASTYSATHHLPGLEYMQYLTEHPDRIPPQLADGKYHYLPGSVLRNANGHWDVPSVRWSGSALNRSADWLSSGWSAVERVVLVRK